MIPSSRCAEAEDVTIKNPCFQLSKILHINNTVQLTSNKLTFMHAELQMQQCNAKSVVSVHVRWRPLKPDYQKTGAVAELSEAASWILELVSVRKRPGN